MKNIKRKLCFHLFDGDGGDGGADGGSISAEARAFADSIGMSEYSQDTSEGSVEYGLPVDGEGEGQVGTDTEANRQEGQSVSTGTETAESLEAEFNQLIGKGGKFAELYGQKVQGAINSRFKNAQDWQGQLEATNDAISILYSKYDLEVGDIEGLKEAIAGDDELISSAAEREGFTVDAYRENLNLKSEAAKGRALAESIRQETEKRETFERWDREAEALKQAFPNFDLEAELNNEAFVAALDRVGNVQDAFTIAHAQDIISGAMANGQQRAVQNLQAQAARPAENGVSRQAAVTRKTDPSKLTDEDMDRIFSGVAQGKSYRF